MVPNGWESKTLGDIATISSGGTPSRNQSNYWSNGTIPWIRTTEVQNCVLNPEDTQEFITKEGLENSSAKLVPSGTLLMAMIGQGKTRGQIALLNFEAATNQNCATIQLKDKNSSHFYFNYLSSLYERIRNWSNSAGQSNLSGALVKAISVLVPPFPEQQKIAKILSIWDKAISTTELLIENSTQQKKALMQQLLTGKKRLLDESGKRFEGEWGEVELSAVAQITMGSSPKSEAYNEVGDGLPLLQGNADIKNRKSVPRIHTSQITKECHVDDILFSVRAPVGTVAISNHHACIGRGIAAIKAKKNHSQDYLYQWFLSFETKWERYSQGSTFEAVNSNDIKSLNLTVPNFKEQQKIATVLTNADKEIELLEQQLADLQQEKKALMQVLLMGKKRVVVDGES